MTAYLRKTLFEDHIILELRRRIIYSEETANHALFITLGEFMHFYHAIASGGPDCAAWHEGAAWLHGQPIFPCL